MKHIFSLCLILLCSSVMAQPCTSEQSSKEYHFVKDYSLKENISRFAIQEKWQLVWDFPGDFPLLANSSFHGELACDLGVVHQIIRQIQPSDLGKVFDNYDAKNKVIYIGLDHKELSN